MADTPSNRARVGDAFEALADGLEPFVDRHMRRTMGTSEWAAEFVRTSRNPDQEYNTSDPSFLFNAMIESWQSTFSRQLPRSIKNLLFTLRDQRNNWAHNRAIQSHDAQFTLGGIIGLLEAIDAKEVDRIRVSLDELNRSIYDKQRDGTRDDATTTNVVDAPPRGLTPWREVIEPHPDVATGTFRVAEFAADLEVVRTGGGSAEYGDPAQFFERTYLTVGLRELLTLAVRRITGEGGGGQPVVNCQTNFGGGKTHALIALYHLFSGVALGSLPPEIRELVEATGATELPTVHRAVVVGNRFPVGQPTTKPDGTVVNTIWGEIAWQLGGAEAYELIAESDQNRTDPGDRMRDVIELHSPCLILIDEWVAYARELYGRGDELPGGSFDTQFGFAQTLTEVVKAVPEAMFVVSIPASEGASSPDDDAATTSIEIGSAAGMEALKRLTAVVSRVAENWKPASSDESFEIVRRRLFQPIPDERIADRDAVADAFGELYRTQRSEFPAAAAEMSYVERIKAAYPIHPEVFDRLYEDWSTVERFQRTRGVLRLMAAVISSLWESDDRSPLILPCSIPLADDRVNAELAMKLPEYWMPVIDADVDGPNSRATQIDKAVPALGRLHATRRVARTIFLGATPNVNSPNRGIETKRIWLGSIFPGDAAGVFASALQRLQSEAPYLYVDRDRYWFDLHQNVNRTASEDAERLLSGDRHEVRAEIVRRLKAERGDGEFRRVHTAPAGSDDVADDPMCRLVVLGPDAPHVTKSEQTPALDAAREILDHRGSAPRQYRNMLVFAAADQQSLDALERSTAEYLAWDSICGRVQELNLDAHQTTQATTRREQTDEATRLRIAETYRFALVPHQDDPVGDVTFLVTRIDSQGTVAEQVSRKLVNEGSLQKQFPAVMLRQQLNDPKRLASRWADGHVAASTLWDDFAKYVYLPRLRDQDVLMKTIESGPAGLAWETDGFALAAGYDEEAGRYLGLVGGEMIAAVNPTTLVVKPDAAAGQLEKDREKEAGNGDETGAGGGGATGGVAGTATDGGAGGDSGETASIVTRFNGSKTLDADRPVRDFGQVVDEILNALATGGGEATISIVIEAENESGYNEQTIRTVTENTATLHFDEGSGFGSE